MSERVDEILTSSELEHVGKSGKKDLDLYNCDAEQSSDLDLQDVDASDLCKDNDLRLSPNNHLMTSDDLVGSSLLINDPVVVNSSSNNVIANTLVLTSVFNSPVKSGEPKHIFFNKTSPDIEIKNDSPVLFASQPQGTFLIPSYDSDHLVHVSTNSVPLYQTTVVGSPLYENLSQDHLCEWQNCTEHFLSLDDLVNHINTTHISGKDSMEYCCKWKDCVRQGKGFNARYKMLIHMRTHTGHKPHKCHYSMCNKRFSRLENLKIHIRSHTGEKPYVCHYEGCHKRYSNSSDRFKHTRTHIESKPYHCKVEGCYKQYTDPSSLRKHLKAHKLGGTVIVNTPITLG